ncbi:MAG: MFS transporter, partial [Archangium sp.]
MQQLLRDGVAPLGVVGRLREPALEQGPAAFRRRRRGATRTKRAPRRRSRTAACPKRVNAAVIVASLGYFVDIYDLLLFGIIRIKTLRSLGLSEDEIDRIGMYLINIQMVGMLIGGIIWGVLGDKRGRLSVLFGSILLYSVANIANGMIGGEHAIAWYMIWRFIAGLGLAGELGAGITLVSEILP